MADGSSPEGSGGGPTPIRMNPAIELAFEDVEREAGPAYFRDGMFFAAVIIARYRKALIGALDAVNTVRLRCDFLSESDRESVLVGVEEAIEEGRAVLERSRPPKRVEPSDGV